MQAIDHTKLCTNLWIYYLYFVFYYLGNISTLTTLIEEVNVFHRKWEDQRYCLVLVKVEMHEIMLLLLVQSSVSYLGI